MSAAVTVRELFQLLLPGSAGDGTIAMIRAYFDDSGTDAKSGTVVMAGIMGTEPEIESLDAMWAQHLASPLDGRKPPLRRFHMYDCFHSVGEFAGWSRTETDYFCHQLRQTILKSHVSGYGFACAREEWDKSITGEYRTVFGDPEGYAVRACMLCSINWASNSTFDPHISFVFDDRPQREQENRAVFNVLQMVPHPIEMVGVAFMNSYKVRPLQAADMVAWEFHAHAERILKHGPKHPAREEVLHLVKNMNLYAQIATNEVIENMKRALVRRQKDDPTYQGKWDDIRSFITSAGRSS